MGQEDAGCQLGLHQPLPQRAGLASRCQQLLLLRPERFPVDLEQVNGPRDQCRGRRGACL